MAANVYETKVQDRAATRERGPSRRANGHHGGRAPAGPFSRYMAQRAIPGVKYVLTVNGYVTAEFKN